MSNRKLIKGAAIVSVDPKIGDLACGDILIEGKVIRAIAPTIEADDCEVIDASTMIAIPGFVDTHRHTWEAPVRAVLADGTHRDYSETVLQRMKSVVRAEDAYAGTLAGSLEALDAGVTTLVDWNHVAGITPEHADASVAALREAGLRAVFAWSPNFQNSWEEEFPSRRPIPEAEAKRLRRDYFASEDQLVTLALGARGPCVTTPETVAEDWRIAREYGLGISFHCGIDGVGPEIRSWHPVAELHKQGLMGPDVTYIHCCTCSDEELTYIRDSGGKVSLAPGSNMPMGIGVPPTGRLLEIGVRPSLSVDVVVNVPGEMFTQMRLCFHMQRMLDYMEQSGMIVGRGGLRDEWSPTIGIRDVLEFATIEGARTAGLDHITGSLTPDKRADIVLISTDSWSMMPVNDPLGAVVNFASVRDIHTVLVDGEIKKRNGVLLDVDKTRVMGLTLAARDQMLSSFRKENGEFDNERFSRLRLPPPGLVCCGSHHAAGHAKDRHSHAPFH